VKNVVWTLADALPLLREVQAAVEPLGYHVGLVGSVLTKGFSYSDMDMVLYPASTTRQPKGEAVAALVAIGMRQTHTREKVHAAWKKMGSYDTKHVEKWMSPDKPNYRGRPVDVFFLS
jgi:hypothetical protein